MGYISRPYLKAGMVVKTKDEHVYLLHYSNGSGKITGMNYSEILTSFNDVVAIWEGLKDSSTLDNVFNCVKNDQPIWKKLDVVNIYTIKEVTNHKRVVCESCHDRGYLYNNCPVCGGNGTHKKSYRYWEVRSKTEEATIDVNEVTGEIKYWTSSSEYYRNDHAFLTKDKAQHVCNLRNAQNNADLAIEQADIVVNTLSFNHNFHIIASNTTGAITGGLISDYGLENFDRVVYLNVGGYITDITFAVSIGGKK